jgi:hypothetical protein
MKPKIIAISEKIYGALLHLYPREHRRDYGEPMAQLFRDQCANAWQAGRSAAVMKLWLRMLPDIGKTCVSEQIASIERNDYMKNLNTKHAPTILTVAGLAFGFLSFACITAQSHAGFMLCITASALCILAKAGVELFRPSPEWLAIAFRTLVIMFAYAIFMPAWAKEKLGASFSPGSHDLFGLFLAICLFVNPVVTAIKLAQFFLQRKKR